MSDVVLKDVTKSFGKGRGVFNINLEVERGTKNLLLGPNGSGKSTLLYLIYGILKPDRGYIEVLGKEPSAEMRRKEVYMLEEKLVFLERSKVIEFVEFMKSLRYFNDEILYIIKEFGIDINSKVYQLSSGQRRLLKLAFAFASNAKVLLLDEPTSNLDIDNAKKILSRIKNYNGTIIFASHDPEAIKAADFVIRIRNGVVEHIETRN